LLVPPDAPYWSILHEWFHYLHIGKVGGEAAYSKLSILERENYVFQQFLNGGWLREQAILDAQIKSLEISILRAKAAAGNDAEKLARFRELEKEARALIDSAKQAFNARTNPKP
jgi:hypothetical protein